MSARARTTVAALLLMALSACGRVPGSSSVGALQTGLGRAELVERQCEDSLRAAGARALERWSIDWGRAGELVPAGTEGAPDRPRVIAGSVNFAPTRRTKSFGFLNVL